MSSYARRPPSKRLRIARACDQCRKRKSKCDGEQPICSICSSAGRHCTYSNTNSRRGLQPGYVRALESILGLMMKHVPGSESTVQNLLRTPTGKTRFPRGSLAEKGADTWRSSSLAVDVDKLLQRFEAADAEGHSDSDGDDAEEEGLAVPAATGPNVPESSRQVPQGFIYPAPLSASNVVIDAPSEAMASEIDAHTRDFSQPFPGNVLELVDFYFTYTHCWLPILERREVLRSIYTSDTTHGGSQAGQYQKEKALVWVICAYSVTSGCPVEERRPLLDPAYIQACVEYRMAMLGNKQPALIDIQTILILVLMRLRQLDTQSAWVLSSKAARLSLIMDESHNPGNDRWQHTFQACGILDHFVSTSLNRRPCISPDDQRSPGQVDEDALEEWETWTGPRPSQGTPMTPFSPEGPLRSLSTFNLVDKLIIWHQRALTVTSDDFTRQLITDLENWRSNLPSDRACVDTLPNNIPTLHLHLLTNFFMCSSIRRLNSGDRRLQTLVESIARETLSISQHYLALTGTLGSTPLLSIVITEHISCLQAGGVREGIARASHIESQLLGVLRVLQDHWREKPAGEYTAVLCSSPPVAVPSGQPCRAPELPARLSSAYGANAFTPFNNSPVSTMDTATSRVGPDICFSNEASQICGTDEVSDANEFDSLFEEMAASMPSSRATTSPLFAQNLGFMTNEADSEFLSFLRYPPDT